MTAFKDHDIYRSYAELTTVDELNCSRSNLTSLEGCPATIEGNFICNENPLTNFMGGPHHVDKTFVFKNENYVNKTLTSLKGIPKQALTVNIIGCHALTHISDLQDSNIVALNLYDTPAIQSWEGLPKELGMLNLQSNDIASFDGIQCSITKEYSMATSGVYLGYNNIESLIDIHHHFPIIKGRLGLVSNPIKEGFMYIFLIKGLTDIQFFTSEYQAITIINKHIPLGKAGLVKCQMELINNGFDEYARM